jgi:condensin complex subunit 2
MEAVKRTPNKLYKQTTSITPLKDNQLQLDQEENDDAKEKEQNLKIREEKRRKSTIHVNPLNMDSPNIARSRNNINGRKSMSRAVRKISPLDLQNLFTNCLKLSSENKINQKNTWELDLIDYIDEVIEDTLNKDESNFQVAR